MCWKIRGFTNDDIAVIKKSKTMLQIRGGFETIKNRPKNQRIIFAHPTRMTLIDVELITYFDVRVEKSGFSMPGWSCGSGMRSLPQPRKGRATNAVPTVYFLKTFFTGQSMKLDCLSSES